MSRIFRKVSCKYAVQRILEEYVIVSGEHDTIPSDDTVTIIYTQHKCGALLIVCWASHTDVQMRHTYLARLIAPCDLFFVWFYATRQDCYDTSDFWLPKFSPFELVPKHWTLHRTHMARLIAPGDYSPPKYDHFCQNEFCATFIL